MANKPHYIGTLSPEMALLGLLYDSPGHGYDLHRKVLNDLGQVWRLSQSQAYTILKRLQAGGDISAEDIPQEKLPARRLLHMTDQGCKRFLDWLNSPSGGSTRAIRMEFVTRLYFLRMHFPEKITPAFDLQRKEVEENVQRLENIYVALPDGQIFDRMSLALRLKQLRSVLEWLDEYQGYFRQV